MRIVGIIRFGVLVRDCKYLSRNEKLSVQGDSVVVFEIDVELLIVQFNRSVKIGKRIREFFV